MGRGHWEAGEDRDWKTVKLFVVLHFEAAYISFAIDRSDMT